MFIIDEHDHFLCALIGIALLRTTYISLPFTFPLEFYIITIFSYKMSIMFVELFIDPCSVFGLCKTKKQKEMPMDYVEKKISKRCFTRIFISWKCPQKCLARDVPRMFPNDESFIMLLKMVVAMKVSQRRFAYRGEEVHLKKRRVFNSKSLPHAFANDKS